VAEHLDTLRATLAGIGDDEVEAAVGILYSAWQAGRTVFVIGNGGSASTASHFALDLAKYTIVPGARRFRVVGLTDSAAALSAWTNDSGWASIFEEQLKAWQEPGDVLVAFSVHGGAGGAEAGPWSQNLVRAAAEARRQGLRVVAFSGFDGGPIRELSEACVVVPALVEELGTPVVESLHVALHHVVVHELRRRIRSAASAPCGGG
jgi:D-sedoheptulose 7-phosphate isomerase